MRSSTVYPTATQYKITALHSIRSTTESSPHRPSPHLNHHAKAHNFPQTQASKRPTPCACRPPAASRRTNTSNRVPHHANLNLIRTSLQPYLLCHHCDLPSEGFSPCLTLLPDSNTRALTAVRHPPYSICTTSRSYVNPISLVLPTTSNSRLKAEYHDYQIPSEGHLIKILPC